MRTSIRATCHFCLVRQVSPSGTKRNRHAADHSGQIEAAGKDPVTVGQDKQAGGTCRQACSDSRAIDRAARCDAEIAVPVNW